MSDAMPTDPDNARLANERLKLWFFRDCNAGTRRCLFSIFGLPTDEITDQGREQIAFKHILSALRQQQAVPGGLDLDAAAQRFRYEHTNACYPDATEFEAREAAEQIVAAALSTQPPQPDDEFIHRAPTSVDPSLEGPGVPDDVREEGREQTAAIAFLAVWYDWHGDPKSWWDALAPDDRFRATNAAAAMLETLHAEIGRAVAVERDTEEIPEVAAMRYIEQLRADEGDSVTILCNDPEAETNDRLLAVECNGAWTDWQDCRFYGETVLQCLAKAIHTRATLAGEGE